MVSDADPGPMQRPDHSAVVGGPTRRNAPAPGSALRPPWPAFATFSVDVYVDDRAKELDSEVLDRIGAVVEAQADLFRSAIDEVIAEAGRDDVPTEMVIGDPMHPFERECECVGGPGWHCPGEDSEHWAKHSDDPDSECGHCGSRPSDVS